MAEKPKKPKHTKLVLPGDKKKGKQKKEVYRAKDRLGRTLTEGPAGTEPKAPEPEPSRAASPDAPGVERPKPPKIPPPTERELPENAVLMPRKNPRLQAVKRKKRLRKMLALVLVLLVLAGLGLYFSGLYLYVGLAAGNVYDSLRIRLTPGDGWPAPFSITGYVTSEGMNAGGFASLGDKDMAVFSSKGKELRRTQHGYANPGISTGSTRVIVYNRGGTEYVVEGRSDTVLRRNTEQEILFAEMSPNGSVAVVTSSRYRANLEIYGPIYDAEPDFSWSMVDEKPIVGAFHADNREFALASLSAQGGALGTTIYLLRTDRAEPLAQVRADDARILQLEYLSQNRLLAVYDTYTALYDLGGEQVARYDYGGSSLLAADIAEGRCALVFGSAARDSFEVVLLNAKLEPLFEKSTQGTENPRVLSASNGLYLLRGQEVEAYSLDGTQVERREYEAKPLDLVQAGVPLVLTVTSAESLEEMLRTGQSLSQAAGGAGQSDLGEVSSQPEGQAASSPAPPASSAAPSQDVPAEEEGTEEAGDGQAA
ncbi:DUF5711 family protein [Ruminococcaceae bacterium OttesenSCG-928-I18]|nr:DUF5711 family protein [Ruminococcaceae bacterium OttesenSCG-928-I18]